MQTIKRLRFAVAVAVLGLLPFKTLAWNIPGHMMSGAIAYQILQRESPTTIPAVRAMLENNPWYESHWRAQLEKLPESERDEYLFMLATRWADDIRTKDRSLSRPLWHHISWPFMPQGEPEWVKTKPPQATNIVNGITENDIAQSGSDPEKRAIALTWVFHLAGDIHQPLHTISLFTREYPDGDRGGNEICVRVTAARAPLSLHRLWDGLLTSSNNTRTQRNLAIELQSKFAKSTLSELASTQPEMWAKESFEIAKTIAYQNGALRGTPKGHRKDCREVTDAFVLPEGYAVNAREIAVRRMILAGYRLAGLLVRLVGQ